MVRGTRSPGISFANWYVGAVPFPDAAARAFNYMRRYQRRLQSLYETPKLLARSKEGEAAQAEMTAIAAGLAERHLDYAESGLAVEVAPLHAALVDHVRPALLALVGAVAFVVLIACANVASLLLVRAVARDREMMR